MNPSEKTRVIYRRYPDGEIIALFPDVAWNDHGNCMSYLHVGQHGGAHYQTVIRQTKPASLAQSFDLHSELKRIGYSDLEIRVRR